VDDEPLAGTFRSSQNRLKRVAAAYVSSADAEDVVQEAFLRAWRQRDQFRHHATTHTWIHRIVVNIAIDTVRRRRIEGKHAAPVTLVSCAPEQSMVNTMAVRRALAALPACERVLCSLHYGWGYTLAELSAERATRVGTLKSRLFATRRRLRVSLSGTSAIDTCRMSLPAPTPRMRPPGDSSQQ
jgi:RNA polymerase sigma-70 factor (ECF subfamily)